jgi:polypeptide N-acetylgalactosaminyltransferase
MLKRRRGVFLKCAVLLAVLWLGIVVTVGSGFFGRSSLSEERPELESRDAGSGRTPRADRGADSGRHTALPQQFERLMGGVFDDKRGVESKVDDRERDRKLQDQFEAEQKRLGEILAGKFTPLAGGGDRVAGVIDLQKYDPQTVSLIRLGLIVPKWNVTHEIPEHQDAPGEGGTAVLSAMREKLAESERQKYDDAWQANAYNGYANDMMSLHRSLPDTRDAACKSKRYSAELPDTSVIIIFHNEAWNALLRTIHSVLDRSPPHLIREIILVDDFSSHAHLKDRLEKYIATLGKVHIVRTPKREGLIRARLMGAAVAVGQVLTFLDSHCECTLGWLEPLLDRIALNWSNVVTPVIDVIDDKTMQYKFGDAKATNVGGFDWNLQFNWHGIPEREAKRRKSDIEPLRSPTMAGGLFAISRRYFEHLGSYDSGMDVWGGENLELSFRVWMCGGVLEIVPCSHVGHIFRSRSPYSWTSPNALRKNSIRVAVVWMDEYSKYYYEKTGHNLGDYGDVTDRKKLRERLKCKSFDWYLKNIYPELFIPGESLASGQIRSKVVDDQMKSLCFDASISKASNNPPINVNLCYPNTPNQIWMLSKTGEIRRDEGCIDYAGQYVMVYPCHGMLGNQEWTYGTDNTIRQVTSNLCIELAASGRKLEMKPCVGTDRQIWYWQRKTPDSELKKLKETS